MNRTAENRERRVFDQFTNRSPLRIVADSVRSMPPPAPDILCRTDDGKHVAFELVELIDEDYARGQALLFKTNSMLRTLPNRLPRDMRDALNARYPEGAFMSFEFTSELPFREREEAALDTLRWLLARPDSIEDHNNIDDALRARVRVIHVHAWRWGLYFDSSFGSFVGDPTLERLQRKFGKRYETEHPIELLMYTELDLLLPDDAWRPAVQPYVEANLHASPFRRVWLFKTGAGTIDFVHPAYP